MMEKLLIIGAGGHGKVVADIAKRMNIYRSILFLDDDEKMLQDNPCVIGCSRDFQNFIGTSDLFVAIGNNDVRKRQLEILKSSHASIATLIHPSAVVSDDVKIGVGTAIMAGSVINPGVRIGEGVIINTCSSVDHDCCIGDYVHIAVGAHLCGTVDVGKMCMIGAGATVVNNISICDRTIIGAGGVVVDTIKESGIYVGVPTKKMR